MLRMQNEKKTNGERKPNQNLKSIKSNDSIAQRQQKELSIKRLNKDLQK